MTKLSAILIRQLLQKSPILCTLHPLICSSASSARPPAEEKRRKQVKRRRNEEIDSGAASSLPQPNPNIASPSTPMPLRKSLEPKPNLPDAEAKKTCVNEKSTAAMHSSAAMLQWGGNLGRTSTLAGFWEYYLHSDNNKRLKRCVMSKNAWNAFLKIIFE